MQTGQTAQIIEMTNHQTPPSQRCKPDTVKTAISDAVRAGVQAFAASMEGSIRGQNANISPETAQAIELAMQQMSPHIGSQMYRKIVQTIRQQIATAKEQQQDRMHDIITQARRPILFIDQSMIDADMSYIGFMLQNTDLMFICADKNIEIAMRQNGICRGQFVNSYIGTMGCEDSDGNARCLGPQADCIIHLGYTGTDAPVARDHQMQVHITTHSANPVRDKVHSFIQPDIQQMSPMLGNAIHTHHMTPFIKANAEWKYRSGKSSGRLARNSYALRGMTI